MARNSRRTGEADAKTRPVHVVRFGRIKAVIWENQTTAGPFYNVTVSRSYKKGNDWHDTCSFGYDDVLTLAKAVNAAHSWIHGKRVEKAEEKSS